MTSERNKLGKAGELLACKHLKRHGYRVLARNYVCPVGELDLICTREGCIVFVEVKSRRDDVSADPLETITRGKQRQLERVARAWLAAHGEPDCAYRFDAISVLIPSRGDPSVRHVVDAFVPPR